jgi:predicted SnoaL-like aldol condensation-catalyzing enzyme
MRYMPYPIRIVLCVAALFSARFAFANDADNSREMPIPQGCNATPAQLEAEKKVATEFFRPDITLQERIALIDPSYVQHNPLFVKMARENHLSDYEQFKLVFTLMAARRAADGSKSAAQPGVAARKPVIVMAEGDLVTVVVKFTIQDPTSAPGTNYELFGWDTFRIRNGKIVEHWDGQNLSKNAVRMARAMEAPAGSPAAPGVASPAEPIPPPKK